MQVNIIPTLARGARMLMDKTTGIPVMRRGIGVIDVRPGLGDILMYEVIDIEDVGILVMMSDNSLTRYYLLNKMYRGTVLAYEKSDDKYNGLRVLRKVLGAKDVAQATKLFGNRVSNWLRGMLAEDDPLALCGRRMWINRVTGLPVSRQESDSLGMLRSDSRLRPYLTAPCIDTFLKDKVVSYSSFQLEQGIVAVVGTTTVTNYIFLGKLGCPFPVLRARFEGGCSDEAGARKLLQLARPMSSEPQTKMLLNICAGLHRAVLLHTFSAL